MEIPGAADVVVEVVEGPVVDGRDRLLVVVDRLVVDGRDRLVVDVVDGIVVAVHVVEVVDRFVVEVVDRFVVEVADVGDGEQVFTHTDAEPRSWSDPSGPDHTMRNESVTFPENDAGTAVLAVAVAFPVLGSEAGLKGVVGNDGVTTTASIRAGDRGDLASRFVTDHSTGARTSPEQDPPVPVADGTAQAPAGVAAASRADAATAAPVAM